MTDSQALKEIVRQEKRFAAAGVGEGENGIVKQVGIDSDVEYLHYRRRQRIHLVGSAAFATLALIGTLIFWR